MEFQRGAETDWTVAGREFADIQNKFYAAMNQRLAESSLADVDLVLGYVPILMSDECRASYPARSRYERKKKFLGCAPQLDHARYIEGDFAMRWTVYCDGLYDAVKLMRRANLSDEQIDEFESILEDIKTTHAPKSATRTE